MSMHTNAEIELATNMVLWFAAGSGESSIEHIAAGAGVMPSALYKWALDKGFVFEGEDYTPLAMLPFIWLDFANVSPTCQALYSALTSLVDANPKVRAWVSECQDELERPIKLHA